MPSRAWALVISVMKNVLVLYSHNFSADYLGDQDLRSDWAPNFDSCDVVNSGDHTVRAGLQSNDGHIQYWHFKHTRPPELDSWVKQLKQILPEGETLDALVLPIAYERETPTLLSWIREMKSQFPALKVIKNNPDLSYTELSKAEEFGRFAWAKTPEAGNIPGYKSLILTGENSEYQVAEGIDVIAQNIRGTASANLLREQLDLSPLAHRSRGR